MNSLTKVNEALEGEAVGGQSRKPLITRGLTKLNGLRCYRFVASFDVRARITSCLKMDRDIDAQQQEPECKRLRESAETSDDYEIVCRKATIHSVKKRISEDITTGSHTHKTNAWHFPQQTLVEVEMAHEEIALAQGVEPG